MPGVEVTSATSSRGKTKAKQRYLKRKKERRKHRPKAAEQQNKRLLASRDIEDIDGDVTDTSQSNGSQSPTLPDKTKRPKKHPRLEDEVGSAMAVDEKEPPPTSLSRMSSALDIAATLPSFPLPALPDAPSKSDLALLGLDQALVDAEIVSPSTVFPIPTGKEAGGTRLSERTRRRLRDIGITELFAVQTALLPFLLPSEEGSNELYRPFNPPRDVCVSAPTGSGKTLAYVLPIIEMLSDRVITRLRALIVLPTRDLVTQVRETIEVLSKGTKLKIGTATGQHSFAHEQTQLVQDQTNILRGGSSKIDILVCTPGRLIDHLVGTPNFSLQHLRFLVIDEADRLLAQSFQDWLVQVLAATRFQSASSTSEDEGQSSEPSLSSLFPDGFSPTFLDGLSQPHLPAFFTEHKASSCQKLLFSATLTQDPGKIAALKLRNPKYFVVQGSEKDRSESKLLDIVMEKFSMPSTLREKMIVTDPSQKPLIFFYIVHTYNIKNALVFTKSAESTIRLVRLLDFFETERIRNSDSSPLVVRAYSSDLSAQERKSILEQFKDQKINILICSDLISRGIDISHVAHVVSYDVPIDMRKYVHRVGRTARAGREGDAWTLVEQQEARYFKRMMKDADHFDKINRIKINEKDLAFFLPHYGVALNNLKDLYTRQG
ncbi:P-loop containing nucleoside triphosphate hydrolase protein [Gymnopilus junonius]|uniref:ATP-dependent RNA helicase n=1 Tax=Gymnopilus junonius TaxID=109634 RepID=A0A9P5NK68_GYMJU|nr:P-loop containing nucleoside triphosphate hydrolase protein [Gymnopilus junonius]